MLISSDQWLQGLLQVDTPAHVKNGHVQTLVAFLTIALCLMKLALHFLAFLKLLVGSHMALLSVS